MPRTSPRPPAASPGGGRPFLNRVEITASGTFVMPARTVWVTPTGGGGGGGGADGPAHTDLAGKRGGGAQTVWRKPVSAAVGEAITVTIGAAGTLGAVGGSGSAGVAGGNGGDTTFGALATAKGGQGGGNSTGADGAHGTSPGSTAAKNRVTDADDLANEVIWGIAIMGGTTGFWNDAGSGTGIGAGAHGTAGVFAGAAATAGIAGNCIVEW